MRANKLAGAVTRWGGRIQIPICSGACFPATNHPLGHPECSRLLFGGHRSGRDIGNLALDAVFTTDQI